MQERPSGSASPPRSGPDRPERLGRRPRLSRCGPGVRAAGNRIRLHGLLADGKEGGEAARAGQLLPGYSSSILFFFPLPKPGPTG